MPVVVSFRRCIRLKVQKILLPDVVQPRRSWSSIAGARETFSGFGNLIPSLVCLAFFFAKGFIKPASGTASYTSSSYSSEAPR
ncbi:hypothetical protein AHAS_Ahas05G0095900 [Arachis hypogaea]